MRASVRALPLLLAVLLLPPLSPMGASDSLEVRSYVDCYIASWEPDTPHASSEILKVSRTTVDNDTMEARALLRFDLGELRSYIPQYSKIINATLVLTTYNTSGPTIEVWDIRGDPDLFGTTWNSERSGVPWDNPGGDLIEKWGEGTGSSTKAEIDMTSYVQAAVDNELESNGWLLIKIAEGQEGYYEFYSEVSGSNGPFLVIEYEAASLGIVLEAPEVVVTQGENINMSVYVTGHLSKAINLSLEGPDFLSYEFSPDQGFPPFNSTLSLEVPDTAPGGSYTVVIRATGVMEASAPVNLTILERRGFSVVGPSHVELVGGLEENISLKVVPTGNFSGEVSAGVLGSPDWLNVSLYSQSGSPPFNVTVSLMSLHGVEASGTLSLVFTGARNRVYEINVTTRVRRVAVYSNEIDWNLSSGALISAANSSGVTLHRINSTDEFGDYDVVIVLGGHKAPTDSFMPSNIAASLLSSEEKASLIEGGQLVHVSEDEALVVIVAGSDRYKTSGLLQMDLNGNGIPLAQELMTGDPRGIRGA